MWRRTRLFVVPEEISVIDLLARLGPYDVVVVDVDDTLVPDQAPATVLAARLGEAHEAAAQSGIGRLLVVSNDDAARGTPGDGVTWGVNKPWTRRSRLGIGREDRVAVIGDRLLPDGLLARRWGADCFLLPSLGGRHRPQLPPMLRALIRRMLFDPVPLD